MSELAADLEHRGLYPHPRLKVTIEAEDGLTKARLASRHLVIAAGLSDDDIDRLIEQAQHEVEPKLG